MVGEGGGLREVRWFLAASLIAAAAVAASLPALRGDWVYDDRILPQHPLLDGLDDVLATFTRTSEDYFAAVGAGGASMATGVTYRPLPMASLALVNALFGAEPLWHHLLGAVLHAASVLLLARLFSAGGALSARGWLVVTAFALSPCLVEAYGWINGRSDLLAGLALLGLANALSEFRAARASRSVAVGIWLLVGALSKETFLVAAAALLASRLLPATARAPSLPSAARLGFALAWSGAAAVMFLARQLAGGAHPPGLPAVDPAQALGKLPRLVALALETFVLPQPQSMRLLSWELWQPWSAAQIALLVIFVGALSWLVWARRYPQLCLVLGALASLAPALIVSEGFWFGFDRYLYMPACLLALACVPERASPRAEPAPARAALAWAGGVALAVTLAALTYANSRAYASHTAFVRTMIEARPRDPSGYLCAAQDALLAGNVASARRWLSAMPAHSLPLPHAHRALAALLSVGEHDRAAQLGERMLALHGPEPRLLIGLARARAAQARWPQVAELYTRALALTPRERVPVLVTLEAQLSELLRSGQVPGDTASTLGALLARVRATLVPRPQSKGRSSSESSSQIGQVG